MMAGLAEAEGVRWYLSDHLGTVRDLADAAGEVIDHLAYDAFGNVLAESNPAAGDRFRFTGREFDAATGQYYYRARYYDGRIGRFTSEDPLGLAAGDVNLYRYVLNRPTAAIDPTGELFDIPLGSYYSGDGVDLLASVGAEGGRAASPDLAVAGWGASQGAGVPTPTLYAAQAAPAAAPTTVITAKRAELFRIRVDIKTMAGNRRQEEEDLQEFLNEALDELTDIADLPNLPLQWQVAALPMTVAQKLFLTKVTIYGYFEVSYEKVEWRRGFLFWRGHWEESGGKKGVKVVLSERLLGEGHTGMLINDPKLRTEFMKVLRGALDTLHNKTRLPGLIADAFAGSLGKGDKDKVVNSGGMTICVPAKVKVEFKVD